MSNEKQNKTGSWHSVRIDITKTPQHEELANGEQSSQSS
jgi:hypothetical protein